MEIGCVSKKRKLEQIESLSQVSKKIRTTPLEKCKIEAQEEMKKKHTSIEEKKFSPLASNSFPISINEKEISLVDFKHNEEDSLFWEYSEEDVWISFSAFSQIILNLAYALDINQTFKPTEDCEINFGEMTQTNLKTGKIFPIRCRKQKNFAQVCDEKESNTCILWQWSFNEEDSKWGCYTKDVSSYIEYAFRKNRSLVISFTTTEGNRPYYIDFNLLHQTNLTSKKVRKIRRVELNENLIPIFDIWKPSNANIEEEKDSILEKVYPESLEYKQVLTKLIYSDFIQCSYSLVSIERVQNHLLYQLYTLQKKWMQSKLKLSTRKILEKQLFHGTSSANVSKIITDGFDVRFNKRSKYGRGNYFSSSSRLAHRYSSQNENKEYKVNQIILKLVLII